MKAMADLLTFQANYSGCMKLGITSDQATVETEWKSLGVPEMSTYSALIVTCILNTGARQGQSRFPASRKHAI